MDKTQIIALAINILKLSPGTLARNVQVPKVDPCLLCGEELLSNTSDPIKEFTLASCGHIFHQKCLEKHLVNGEAICPNKECNEVIETSLSPELEKDKDKDKEVELQKSTKSSADETNATTTELTNTTATTVATAKQVDSDQTPVDDADDPLESERRTELQLTGSTKVSLDQTQAMDVDKGEEEGEQSVVDQEIDVDDGEVEVYPDTVSKKRSNEATDSSSIKKAKTKVEDSRALKNFIRELSIGTLKVSEVREKEGLFKLQQEVGNSRIFLTLYSKITNAEEKHENSNQDVIRAYYFFGEALYRHLDQHKKTNEERVTQELVNDEVREQLPKEVTKNALRKRTEKAQKIYDLFRRIGADKIQRVRTFSASRIAKLSSYKIDYVVKEVIALL